MLEVLFGLGQRIGAFVLALLLALFGTRRVLTASSGRTPYWSGSMVLRMVDRSWRGDIRN